MPAKSGGFRPRTPDQGAALDPQRDRGPFDPIIFKWFGGEGADGAVATGTVGPLSPKPLKYGVLRATALSGVQGQRPWSGSGAEAPGLR
jgi:hypothetical protein